MSVSKAVARTGGPRTSGG